MVLTAMAFDFVDYDDLFNKYDTLNKISFDYAVVEPGNPLSEKSDRRP